jgi:hypothetical protein
MRRCCWLPLLFVALAITPSPLRAQVNVGPVNAERLVMGTVVAVNAERALITVRPSNLLGRFLINLNNYRVKQPMVLNGLHSGDRIVAVYWSSDGMLHRLRRLRNYQVFQEQRRD